MSEGEEPATVAPSASSTGLTAADISAQAEGLKYLATLAENEPSEYTKLYQGLPAEAKAFIRFLRERAQAKSQSLRAVDPGPTTTITVSRSKGAADPIVLIENLRGTVPVKKSLCTIFNELESEGFRLVKNGAAGASYKKTAESEIVFVFKRVGKQQ